MDPGGFRFLAWENLAMQWLNRVGMSVAGLVMVLYVSGCDDVEGQVADTIGLAWNIVSVWLD